MLFGFGARLIAGVSAHSLRVVGAVGLLLSAGVASLSITTTRGLTVKAGAADRTATVAADAGVVTALVEFGIAHPAYPVAAAVGCFLLVAGDEAPLVG